MMAGHAMTEEERTKYLQEVAEKEKEMLLDGGERCGRCGVMWEDTLAALSCPCHDYDEGYL